MSTNIKLPTALIVSTNKHRIRKYTRLIQQAYGKNGIKIEVFTCGKCAVNRIYYNNFNAIIIDSELTPQCRGSEFCMSCGGEEECNVNNPEEYNSWCIAKAAYLCGKVVMFIVTNKKNNTFNYVKSFIKAKFIKHYDKERFAVFNYKKIHKPGEFIKAFGSLANNAIHEVLEMLKMTRRLIKDNPITFTGMSDTQKLLKVNIEDFLDDKDKHISVKKFNTSRKFKLKDNSELKKI
jgi:hypothetical protein